MSDSPHEEGGTAPRGGEIPDPGPEQAPEGVLRSGRRGLIRWGAAALAAGAASLVERPARAHPLASHEGRARVEPPGYRMEGRELENRGRGMDMRPVWEPTPPLDAPRDDDAYHRFHIEVQLVDHEYLPGIRSHVLAFNQQVPGPMIRVPEGEWVKVELENDTDLMHTIHWHGMFVPTNMDGVPFVTQPPAMPGQTFIYRFRALPYGTHFYHCHFGTPLHMQSAMHGALIVERDEDPIQKDFPYTREYTLILNQVDTAMVRREMRHMLQRMRERIVLMRRGRMTDRILARFASVEEFLAAVRDGWIPPYRQARNGPPSSPSYNIYTMNGKAYPMTPKLHIRRDELIRIRLINVGAVEHYMHLHGHDFWEVARDGAVLPHAFRGNTIPVTPGRTHDIIVEGSNPGVWTFHDHATSRATNNGLYPGGILTTLHYEDFEPEYPARVALDE